MTVLITGGTGLVGRALTKHLLQYGYKVIILTRDSAKYDASNPFGENVKYAEWNIAKQTIDPEAIEEADYIVHLAGAGVVDKPWTLAYKLEIQHSRIDSGILISKYLQRHPNKVKAVISSSATGWYGADRDSSKFVETDPPSDSFLGETCRKWEEAIEPVQELGKRLAILRTGIVLSNEGGALKEFKKPLKFGVAGVLGSGKQMVSWIHIDDLCRMYQYAIEHETMNGVYNAVAPNPVNNRTLTLELARKLRGFWFVAMPVPGWALKLVMGDRSIEVLKSTHVSAAKIMKEGFQFLYPTITKAMEELVQEKKHAASGELQPSL